MARSLSSDLDVKRKDLLSVFPKDLIVNPANRGREFPPSADAVRALSEDIKKNGQLQPVSVSITHDKKLELVAGFTRFEALLLLNAEAPEEEQRRILCQVIDGNAEDMFLANISENRLRNETSAIDDAYNIRRLERDFSKSDEEIRTIYGGKSQAWLDQMRKLLTLSRQQQEQIHYGQLTASTGFLLADMAPADREAVVEQAKAASKGEKVTTTQVLKAARESGTLTKVTSLKQSEIKTAHEYLGENTDSPKVKKFVKAYLDYASGNLPEPDYYRIIKRLLGE